MKCKSCRKLVFEWREGSLTAARSAALGDHLSRCADCRAFYEAEERLGSCIGRVLGPGFASARATGSPALLRDEPPGRLGLRWGRFLLPAGAAAAILAAVLVYRSLPSPRLIEPTSPEPVVLDDFPDPLRDWAEGRVILTVEDSARGTRETFLTTRDGTIRRVADKGTKP
jgi:hypothetical protein